MIALIIFISLTMVHGQKSPEDPFSPRPEKCYGTNDLFERRCCIVPAFFDREVVRSCGAFINLVTVDKSANVAIIRRHSTGECSYWACILNKYKILNPDKSVNEDSFFTYLDKWVTYNPAFSTVMLGAKMSCRQRYILFMPLSACEFYDFLLCIRSHLNLDCPSLIQSKECFEWKEFFDECKQYYV